MFGWLVWASLLSLSNQDMNGQDNGVLQCRPQNVKVDTLTEKQRISLTWEDGPSCARVHEQLIYEVEVRIDNKQVLLDDVVVLPDQTGIVHSWNWTSPLPLECASHSVRLRSKYQNHTSEWSHLQTIPGKNSSDETQVFPNDRVVEVGSNFTFCCILGAESTFEQMKFRQYSKTQMTTTKISDRIYTMTAHLHTPSPPAATDVFCNSNRYAASVFIGYPPGDMNLTCETRDLESVECHWSKGRDTHLYARRATYYLLNGSHCNTVGCTNKICKCNQNVQVDVGEKNWTLRAQNPLGVVEITDKADLSKRVHMFAPEKVTTSSVNARNVSLRWQWTVQKYNTLHLECQVRLSYSGRTDTRNVSGFGLTFTVLNGLIPKQKYTVQIQCGTKRHFWKTGDWSENFTFETKEENALDVWMQLKNNQTVITWKTPSANQIHGQIEGYEVTWGSTTEKERQKKTVLPSLNSIGLSLDASKEHIVTVTARTSNGSSLPSSITVTGFYPEINSSKITGSNGGFDLSWSPSPAASCGYVVDWCPTFGECSVEWTTVPVGVTKARIVSENFKDGVRYNLSIYACTEGAPELLEKREGFVTETNDPEASSLMARNLPRAQTSRGEGGDASLAVPMDPLTENSMVVVIISLATVFVLLPSVTILCYRNWTCVKQKIYPPIPKPVLKDDWITQPGDQGLQILQVTLCPHSEIDIVGARNNGINQEEEPLITAQTQSPKGYYNQHLKKSFPAPLTLSPKTISSPTESPSLVSTSMIENLTYNMGMQTTEHNTMEQSEEYQPNTVLVSHQNPEIVNIMTYVSLERNSNDYEPRSPMEPCPQAQGGNDTESPFSISLTYLLIQDSSSSS